MHYRVNLAGGFEADGVRYVEGVVYLLADESWLPKALARRHLIETDAGGRPLARAPVPLRLPPRLRQEGDPPDCPTTTDAPMSVEDVERLLDGYYPETKVAGPRPSRRSGRKARRA